MLGLKSRVGTRFIWGKILLLKSRPYDLAKFKFVIFSFYISWNEYKCSGKIIYFSHFLWLQIKKSLRFFRNMKMNIVIPTLLLYTPLISERNRAANGVHSYHLLRVVLYVLYFSFISNSLAQQHIYIYYIITC